MPVLGAKGLLGLRRDLGKAACLFCPGDWPGSAGSPFTQESRASIGSLLPDTHTVFAQTEPHPAVQGSGFQSPQGLTCHLICVLGILLLLAHPPVWRAILHGNPSLGYFMGSWSHSCAKQLKGLNWNSSLSNVDGGVLKSGKLPAKFHNPRPGSTCSSAPSGG